MKCPVLSKCCFCLPLRKGVLILGYITLIICLLCLLILIIFAVEGMTTEDIFEELHEKGPKIPIHVIITFAVLDVIMSNILLFGVHKKKKNLLKIYFYIELVWQILTLCNDVIIIQYNTVLEKFVYFFIKGLNFYLLFLVYNLTYTIEVIEELSPAVEYTNHNQNTNLNV